LLSIGGRRLTVLLLLCIGASALVLGSQVLLRADVVTVDWDTTYQTIDGFGASVTGYTNTFTADQADKFFSSSTGLGLSLLRIRVTPTTLDEDCGCVSNSTPYSCVKGTKTQILSGDLQIAKLADERGVTLFAAPWSPPATMKTSGKYCSGGSLIGNPQNYHEYAADLADFPVLLREKGLSIYAMSVQNEPNVENPAYDTCNWTAEQIHDFTPYLSDALTVAGFRNIRIAVPEEFGWTFDRMKPAMDDLAVASRVGLILGHAYRVAHPSGIPSMNDLHVWQTEVSSGGKYDGGMGNAIGWAKYIHNYLTVGANAWMYWSLDCGPRFFNHDSNMCLTDQRSSLAKRAYVLGQYARFVRPGWQRIGIENDGSMLVTAFRGPDKKFAIVAVNDKWLLRKQTFSLRGFPRVRSLTPWLTSSTASLAVQPAVLLNSDEALFQYTVPARSVMTFEGRAD
jgi:glucuronoarabinoxylan endo-1,4-beta-xylanase